MSLSYVHACWVIGHEKSFWVSSKDTKDKKEGGEDTKEEELESFLYVGIVVRRIGRQRRGEEVVPHRSLWSPCGEIQVCFSSRAKKHRVGEDVE